MWTQKSTLALIEDIRLHPCLWDTLSDDYKSRSKKAVAYRVLADKYGVNPKDIDAKFQALKNQFRREHRRLEKHEEGLSPKQIHWFGYEHLLFLLNACVKPSKQEMKSHEQSREFAGNSDSEYTEYEALENTELDTQPINFTALKSKQSTATATEAFKCMRTLAEKICSKDEFDVFGEYIAHKLRKCGRTNREISIAQHEINTICFRLSMGEFAQNFEDSMKGSIHSNLETEQEELKVVEYVENDPY